MSDDVFDVAPIMRRHESAVRFVVVCRLPFEIKLIYFLCVLAADQLSDELELLAETENRLLENRHFFWSPSLEDRHRRHGVYENVQVPFLVEMIYGVEVQFDGLFLLLRIGFIDIVLRVDDLKNWVLFGLKSVQERPKRVLFAAFTGLHE